MFLYVELWKARPKWLELSPEERKRYFEVVGSDIQKILDTGVELIGFAINDEDTPYRGDYRYMAVWKMSDMEQVELLESSVERADWHLYFEQINARGELVAPPQAIEDMARLQ